MIDLSQLLPIAVVLGFILGIGLIVWEICAGRHLRRVLLWIVVLIVLVFAPVTLLLHQNGQINLPAPISSSHQLLIMGARGSNLAGLNANDATVHWQHSFSPDENAIEQRFTLSGSMLYGAVVARPDWKPIVYALRASDGSIVWQTDLAALLQSLVSPMADPVVADGLVYVPVSRSLNSVDLYALRASDGKLAWHANLANFSHNSIPPTLLTGDGRVFLANMAGDLRVLRSSDGSLAWSTHLVNRQYTVGGDPGGVCALAGDLLYTISPDKHSVVGLRASDGQAAWHLDLGNLSLFALSIIHDHLYLSTNQGNVGIASYLYLFDLQNARPLWKSSLADCFMPELTESGSTLYSGCGVSITAQRLSDGSQIWTRSDPSTNSIYGQPALVDGVLFVQSTGLAMRYMMAAPTTLDALSSADGSYYWRYTFSSNTGEFLGMM